MTNKQEGKALSFQQSGSARPLWRVHLGQDVGGVLFQGQVSVFSSYFAPFEYLLNCIIREKPHVLYNSGIYRFCWYTLEVLSRCMDVSLGIVWLIGGCHEMLPLQGDAPAYWSWWLDMTIKLQLLGSSSVFVKENAAKESSRLSPCVDQCRKCS